MLAANKASVYLGLHQLFKFRIQVICYDNEWRSVFSLKFALQNRDHAD